MSADSENFVLSEAFCPPAIFTDEETFSLKFDKAGRAAVADGEKETEGVPFSVVKKAVTLESVSL